MPPTRALPSGQPVAERRDSDRQLPLQQWPRQWGEQGAIQEHSPHSQGREPCTSIFLGDEGQERDMPSQAQHMLLRLHAGTQLLATQSCLVTGSKSTQDSMS